MESSYLLIFNPDNKKFHLTPNWIVIILSGITIAFFWLFDDAFPPRSTFRYVWLLIAFFIFLYYLVASFFTYKPLNGVLDGRIKFDKDQIVVNNKAFELKNINDLDFYLEDFYGRRVISYGANLNPVLSQGVANSVTFTDRDNQTHLIYFKLEGKKGFLYTAPFINEAVKQNKISFHRAIELLGIENVNVKY